MKLSVISPYTPTMRHNAHHISYGRGRNASLSGGFQSGPRETELRTKSLFTLSARRPHRSYPIFFQLSHPIKMHSFRSAIAGNRSKNAELSEAIRSPIIYAHESREKPTQIASHLGISRQTVYNTINPFKTTGTLQSRHRSGRASKLTPTERRYIFRLVRRNPIMSYKALISETGFWTNGLTSLGS
jgi:hypothetical protein